VTLIFEKFTILKVLRSLVEASFDEKGLWCKTRDGMKAHYSPNHWPVGTNYVRDFEIPTAGGVDATDYGVLTISYLEKMLMRKTFHSVNNLLMLNCLHNGNQRLRYFKDLVRNFNFSITFLPFLHTVEP
jgi:hypothetical protein